MIHHHGDGALLLVGDALEVLAAAPERSVNCIVTSPPYYGLRDYGAPGQYGLEPTPAAYVETMRALFAEARRVLADDGTLWLNLGDSYSSGMGAPNKDFNERWHGTGNSGQRKQEGGRPSFRRDGATAAAARRTVTGMPTENLLGIPWRVAFALQDDGWILRNEIIWHKPNAMPSSVRDRLSNRRESLFLFTKKAKYFFNLDAIREQYSGDRAPSRRAHTTANKPHTATGRWSVDKVDATGRNPGDVWSISTRPFPQAHFATFPVDLPLRCIKAGCTPGGIVLDPCSGAGTTGLAALQLGRQYIGIDLNAAYHDMAIERFAKLAPKEESIPPAPRRD
ncbi:site-specific DNA-methyltransferase [Streptomyces sp. WAC 01529]|uniref:DNA-methyltransferase n=1 Tax=Streptomyces sp. WAC 01529 TaxID=2203205 RepID=UPI001F0BF18E|nr:site-specific DNA-methyltransferase [Streptomyces sp. WAC 01529]